MAVLLLDSDPNRRKTVVEALERSGPAFEIEAAAPGSEAMRRLSEDGYDVILDCGQPEKDRLTMLQNIQRRGRPTQVIVVTDEGSEDEARRAMQEGASDYIVRTETYLTALPVMVEKACKRCRLLAELQSLDPSTSLRTSLREGEPKSPPPLSSWGETMATIEPPSDSNEALRDALDRMQKALEEVNVLLEKSQIGLDGRASALEQAVAEARRQARDMSTLNAIADVISRSSVLDEVLSNALDKVLEATETKIGAVLVLDEEAKKIVITSQHGLSEEFAQAIADVKNSERTFLWRILSGNSLLVDGISSDSDGYGLLKEMEKEGIGSLLGVPLRSKGKVRGAMVIAAGEGGHLTTHDLDFLTIVGRQTGLAVENIQLREEIWRAAQEWLGEIEEIAEGGETGVRLADEQCPESTEGAGALSTPRPLDQLGTAQARGDASSGHRLENLTKTALEIEDEVQRQNRELWTINAVAEAISQSFDLDEILGNVVSKLTAVMGIEASWVYLVEATEGEEEPELFLRAHWGVSERFVQGMTRVKMDEGLNGQVATSGAPLLIEDLIEGEVRTKLVVEQEGLRSFAGVPMKAKDRVVGVIAVASHMPGPFAPHEVRMLISISNQVGIAIEKVRLYHQVREYAEQQEKSNEVLQKINVMLMESQAELEEQIVAVKKAEVEIQQRNRELSALNAIATTVNQHMDFEKVSLGAIDKVLETLNLAYGEIFIFDQKVREMTRVVSHGESPQFAFSIEQFGLGEGLLGLIAQDKKPLLIEDIASDTRFIRGLEEKGKSYSVVGIPLFAQDQLVGGMDFFSTEGHPFSSTTVDLLTTIGHQIGVAVANARLFEEVKQAAEQLRRANDELQELNRLKSDFIAVVSHELRTPLASIIGYVDLMLDEKTGPLNEEQDRYLGIIERNTDRLSHIVNDILDISRIEAGRIDLAMAPLDVVEIARETVVIMQPQAQAKGIEMSISMAEGLPLVQGDPNRIRQVLVNLLGNAIKFTPQGGQVEIGSRCLAAGEQPPPPGPELEMASDWLLVSVRDSGVGIGAGELPRIFDKFYQAGGFAHHSVGGSGLGLSIVQGIVEAHGGRIWAQSAGENQGSTFTFALPVLALGEAEGPGLPIQDVVERGEVEGIEAPTKLHPELIEEQRPEVIEELTSEAPTLPLGTAMVLVVDDDPDAVSLLQLYLEAEGYSVTGAQDGETALQLAMELQPAVILLDLLMPELDGFAVLERLKAHTATQDIPVVIVSALADQEKGFSLGAIDYLTKPIDRQRLLGSVRRLTRPKSLEGVAPSVLIVDDDKELVDLVRIHLLMVGNFTVTCAYDGREAMEKVREQIPDLIILDILMPEMDGFEVVQALKGDPRTRHVPVIILTAKDLTEKERESLQLGTTRYLTKTLFSQEDLLAEVRDMIGMLTEGGEG
jgi:signal transduction histidine kinase/CheY-like chemotaxis protein